MLASGCNSVNLAFIVNEAGTSVFAICCRSCPCIRIVNDQDMAYSLTVLYIA